MVYQINPKELSYHRNNFYENLKVHGIPCKIYSIHDIHSEAYDFYHDIVDESTSFDNSINSYITYEEVPTIKTLKSLGWYVESEALPIVAYIPVIYEDRDGVTATFSPSIDDKIVLRSNPFDTNTSERAFLLKDFKGNGFPSAIYYTCKLVPYRKE